MPYNLESLKVGVWRERHSKLNPRYNLKEKVSSYELWRVESRDTTRRLALGFFCSLTTGMGSKVPILVMGILR